MLKTNKIINARNESADIGKFYPNRVFKEYQRITKLMVPWLPYKKIVRYHESFKSFVEQRPLQYLGQKGMF